MIRQHEDVDGCGCFRCQDVDHEVVHRSLVDAFSWSTTIPVARPSVVLVLGAVGVIQLATLVVSPALALLLAVAGVVGVFFSRGYIGIVAQGLLGCDAVPSRRALRLALVRLPAFLGAAFALVLGIALFTVFVVSVVLPAARTLTSTAGVDPVVADFGALAVLVLAVVYALLKSCFVPEACFVGGYGPLDSVRVSWRLTGVHRLKVAFVLAGFVALLALGTALDTTLAGSDAPVALSFEFNDTTVVIRSFGLSVGGSVRFLFDLTVTALYSGLFVHQYVDNSLGSALDE
ncbi:hypothetical protein SAMN05216226_11346 [Halovenus aranensis]|uniref:Uncharacterized protein n=1 Tax=Halovenus aranensis TaxID=890420 RepID=A0A1G8Y4L3_9EURY|nr:hypothetical protein [Halovenus aranensis]SDJ97085.1 hypothetical protein SAMN05216226_11346 [Halovenus aranensis]